MKTLQTFILLLSCIQFSFAAGKEPTNESLLRELDRTIKQKTIYHQQKERETDSIKSLLRAADSLEDQYTLYGTLFGSYLHFQADSALLCLERREVLIDSLHNPSYKNDLRIAKAEVLGIMGLYNEVPEQLQQIQREKLSPGSLLYYYYTCRTFYGWIADYTRTEDRHKYIAQTNAYRDSILSVTPDGTDHNIVLADKLIVNGKPDEAIELMNKELQKAGNAESSIYILYNLSLAYAQKGDTEKQIYYLAQTAIGDLKAAKREYLSLQKLALIMFEKGDIDRAYKYLSCSMEDAVACNARLRSVEVTEFFPIVDKVYKMKVQREKQV